MVPAVLGTAPLNAEEYFILSAKIAVAEKILFNTIGVASDKKTETRFPKRNLVSLPTFFTLPYFLTLALRVSRLS